MPSMVDASATSIASATRSSMSCSSSSSSEKAPVHSMSICTEGDTDGEPLGEKLGLAEGEALGLVDGLADGEARSPRPLRAPTPHAGAAALQPRASFRSVRIC